MYILECVDISAAGGQGCPIETLFTKYFNSLEKAKQSAEKIVNKPIVWKWREYCNDFKSNEFYDFMIDGEKRDIYFSIDHKGMDD